MPITIEQGEEFLFNLSTSPLAAGKIDAEFNMFLGVRDVLLVYPVKFEITVEPGTE